MKIKSLKHQINVDDANNIMECTIIVHPELKEVIEDQIRAIGCSGNCKIVYQSIEDVDLINIPLKDVMNKRVMICTTVPGTESVSVAKKYHSMAMVLSKLRLPEYMEVRIEK